MQAVGPFANISDQLYGDYASQILPQFCRTVAQGLAGLGAAVRLGPAATTPSVSITTAPYHIPGMCDLPYIPGYVCLTKPAARYMYYMYYTCTTSIPH